jgi:uncharacterized protein (TIRG00374 family)
VTGTGNTRRWRWLALGAGLAVFAWMFWTIGPAKVGAHLRSLGWSAALVPFPFLLVYAIDAFGWQLSFGRKGAGVGYATLLKIRWAGEAINYILPTAYVGGEAVKVYLLRKRGVAPTFSGPTAVVSKSCQTLAMVMFIFGGACMGLRYLPVDSPAKQGMLMVAALAAVGVTFLFLMQRRGLFGTAMALFRRLGFRLAVFHAQEAKLRQMDESVRRFYGEERIWFTGSSLVFFCGWMADTLEIFLVAHLLGVPMDWSQAFALEAFIAVAKAVGMFSPGSLGIQEIGVVFLFRLFGLPEALGISYALIRRGREFVFGLVGWFFIVTEEHSVRELQAHMGGEGGPG